MSENSNNLDLFYKKKYYKYKNKYLIEKNKLDGGLITFKSGLFGFFVNECYAASMDINFDEGKDAPSINTLNNKLHANGLRIKNNSDTLELLVNNKHRTKQFMKDIEPFFIILGIFTIFVGGVSMYNVPSSSNTTTTKTHKYTLYRAYIEKCKVNLNRNSEIISLMETFICRNIPFNFRWNKSLNSPDPNINIDCCIIIEVNRLGKNKFKRIVRLPPPSNIVKL